MKIPRPSVLALLAAVSSVPALQAQTATTDPVGFVSYTVNANSDQKIGVPMTQGNVFSGVAGTVSGTTVSSTGIPSLSGKNLLLVTSGSASGSWEEVSSSTGTSVVLAAPISGFAANDSFVIRPFWTLSTLFPNGGAVPNSPDVENPRGLVLLNDLAAVGINPASGASYFYTDGSGGLLTAGWYANGTFEAANNVVISPESFITVRNLTASIVNVSFVGSVPVKTSTVEVVARAAGQQDNLILNQFPAAVRLADAGLVTSGAIRNSPDVENPVDLLLVYNQNSNGLNPASSASYFYTNGSGLLPAGWYANGTFEAADNVQIPAGAAIVIRKGAGTSSVTKFTPALPYSL
jgi:uncharacterized protein (TIGR02597 family)